MCRRGYIVDSSLGVEGLQGCRRNEVRADVVAPSVHDPDLATYRNRQQWSPHFFKENELILTCQNDLLLSSPILFIAHGD